MLQTESIFHSLFLASLLHSVFSIFLFVTCLIVGILEFYHPYCLHGVELIL